MCDWKFLNRTSPFLALTPHTLRVVISLHCESDFVMLLESDSESSISTAVTCHSRSNKRITQSENEGLTSPVIRPRLSHVITNYD